MTAWATSWRKRLGRLRATLRLRRTWLPPARPAALAAACAALAAAAAGSATAGTPLPRAPAGSGHGSTQAVGKLDGAAFSAVSAIVTRDFYGDLNVYMFAEPRACGPVSSADGAFLWLSIDTAGAAVQVGQPLVSGDSGRVVATVSHSPRPILLRRGVSVTFTHVDPRVGSRWYGQVRVQTSAGTAVSGPFAAVWCGRV